MYVCLSLYARMCVCGVYQFRRIFTKDIRIIREPCVWNVNIVLCCGWGWRMWLCSYTAHGLSCLWEKYFNCSQTQMKFCDLAATAAAVTIAAALVGFVALCLMLEHISLNHWLMPFTKNSFLHLMFGAYVYSMRRFLYKAFWAKHYTCDCKKLCLGKAKSFAELFTSNQKPKRLKFICQEYSLDATKDFEYIKIKLPTDEYTHTHTHSMVVWCVWLLPISKSKCSVFISLRWYKNARKQDTHTDRGDCCACIYANL